MFWLFLYHRILLDMKCFVYTREPQQIRMILSVDYLGKNSSYCIAMLWSSKRELVHHLLRLHRKIRLVARNYHYRHIEPRQNHSESHRLDYKDRRPFGGGRH